MIKLARYLKAYKKEVILGPLFKIIEAIFELIVPLVMASIIDKGIASLDKDYIIKMGFVLLGLAIVGLLSTLVCQYLASRASQGYGTTLRLELFSHINSFSHQELDKFGSHSLINRLTTDVNQMQVAVAMLIRLVIRAPFLVIGATIMAISISPILSLIFLGAAIIIATILYLIMNRQVPYFKVIQKELDDVALITKENLTGARVIRAFAKEQDEEQRFNVANDELKKASIRASFISTLLNPLTYIIVNIAIIAILYFGGIEVNIGNLTQGEVIALINYMNQILLALIVVANLVIIFTKARASAARINEVLDTTSTLKEGELQYINDSNSNREPFLIFQNVSFSYNKPNGEKVLNDLTFTINKGETIGIIGTTGSGKSTLVNLIPRFYDVDEGEINYRGKDLRDYSFKTLRENIGIVPQKAVLFHGTIRENIQMGKHDATDQEIKRALSIAQALDFVMEKEEKLDHLILQGGKNLSGGQRQRLAIARGIVNNSDIIILDDVGSALDYQTDFRLRKSIREKLIQSTIFIVSQRISSVQNADRIIVLKDGKIVGFDKHDSLLQTCEEYQNIFKSQNREANDEF